MEDARAENQRALRREQDITERERNSAMGLAKEKAALERELKDFRLELERCEAASSPTSEETTSATGGGGYHHSDNYTGGFPLFTTRVGSILEAVGSSLPAVISGSTAESVESVTDRSKYYPYCVSG